MTEKFRRLDRKSIVHVHLTQSRNNDTSVGPSFNHRHHGGDMLSLKVSDLDVIFLD